METVQETLEQSLSQIAATPIRVSCAGRTDTGVHACYQVVHLDCPVSRPARAWLMGANTLLPDDVAVQWVRGVPPTFHARFAALARRYRYLVRQQGARPGVGRGSCCWHHTALDGELMHVEAQCLLGEQDFSAFRAAGCQSRTPMRRVEHISVTQTEQLLVIDIQANAFLHHMVRNIAGALLALGSGNKSRGWLAELLGGRDRRLAPATAPAAGLYLVDVIYPPEFGLPRPATGPWPLSM